MNHDHYIDNLCRSIGGIEQLKQLQYDLIDGNVWELSRRYGIAMYDIRYLLNWKVEKHLIKYLREKENRPVLRLIYSKAG